MIIHGDCVEEMKKMDEASIDAVVCDPPYGLGFMGQSWDNIMQAEDSEVWHLHWALEAIRILRPGGHLAAMGGTRTFHRLVCAIEDAGFEVRDTLCWQYVSGFPKSRESLKPSWEPIALARKPLIGTVAQNVLEHGTGGLGIDGCRVDFVEGDVCVGGFGNEKIGVPETGQREFKGASWQESPYEGRWPSNTIRTEPFGDDRDKQFLSPVVCVPKASKSEKEFGCEDLDDNKPLHGDDCVKGKEKGLTVSNAKSRRKNNHPTCKPIALFRHLVRLLTPEGGTVLDPFFGSGTTGCAAEIEGFDWIGIEQDEHYCRIAEARTKAWAERAAEQASQLEMSI
jgi:site-specific DNA-methyltransferase (adenine-specific)